MSHKILIVDDDQFIRELYEEVLNDAGYTVQTAKNGREGLDKILKGGYNLILLDVVMPEMDGTEVIEKLHDIKPEKPNGDIIFLTNLDFTEKISVAMQDMVHSYIMKAAITPQELLQTVKTLLAESFKQSK